MNYSLIILAAGSGKRTQLSYNKMFYQIDDECVISKSLKPFLDDKECKQIIMVINPKEQECFMELFPNTKIEYVAGGKERQNSVYNGLKQVKYEYVLVHDGARCFVTNDLINRLKTSLNDEQAVIPGIAVVDTIKLVDDGGKVVETPKRSNLKAIQTPQAFQTSLLLDAHKQAIGDGYLGSDDASLIEKYKLAPVLVIDGELTNKKITTNLDL